jgi:probable phosphoglycerate mutase
MKLILIRHGETEANFNHILQGRIGGKLTQKGIDQAKNVGKELKEKYKIDMVFCSPLARAVETLENILSEDPIEGGIFMSKLLEERDMGEYTGMGTHSINWDELDKNNKINKKMGVESWSELGKRVNLFLEDLKLEEAETVLVVSHRDPLIAMINKITGKKISEIDVKNAEILVFEEFK